MCTVSWLHTAEGYELFCNRDEKRTRLPASGPAVQFREGIRYTAPKDGNCGGTWIATNQYGLSLCLLNRQGNSPGRRSRGLVLPDLVTAADSLDVLEKLWDADLTGFAPFTMLVLEPFSPAAIAEWTGEEKQIVAYGEPFAPLASSSYDPSGVAVRRKEQFRKAAPATAEEFVKLHGDHGSMADAYSPCMHREDAETVSFSHVRVTLQTIDFRYVPSAPCRHAPEQFVSMERTP